MSEPTLQCDVLEFKQAAGEFFRSLQAATLEQADKGFKCLTLMYLGMEGTDLDQHQAKITLDIAGRKLLEKENDHDQD